MHLLIDLKLTWAVVLNYILRTNLVYVCAALFVAVLFTLQWLFNIDQLRLIVFGDSGLGFFERIDFLLNGFLNIFRFIDDFTPIAMILIAAFQAVSLTLIIGNRHIQDWRSKQGASFGLGILGVGCVACGGSLLTPILGLVASGVSVSFAELVSDGLLLIALVLSYVAMTKMAFLVANQQASKGRQ